MVTIRQNQKSGYQYRRKCTPSHAHEHNTVNSQNYSEEFGVKFLRDNGAIHLTFDHVDFSGLRYHSEKTKEKLDHLMKKVSRDRGHEKARAVREG